MNIPEELLPRFKTIQEADEFDNLCYIFWRAGTKEFFDPEFAARTHFNRKTAQAGCSGPFCMAGKRQADRKREGASPNEAWKTYEPILEYFFECILTSKAEATEALKAKLLSSTDCILGALSQDRPINIDKMVTLEGLVITYKD